MKKIAFHTLGCKVNYAESSSIAREFMRNGYSLVDFSEAADIYVIHTCTVTSQAERKCIAAVRRAIKKSRDARVAVIGCMADLNSARLMKEEGVELVLGNADKFSLFERLHGQSTDNTTDGRRSFIPSFSEGERTRTFYKIQDGCDYFCSYCAIPHARGRSRSAGTEETLKGISGIANGCAELVLTGINIGDFGKQNGESLYDLLLGIEKIEGIRRVRLSSIEPDLLTEDIIRLFAESEKLMPHFHIPLQSGSDSILKAMNRRYDTAFFAGKIRQIRHYLPHACIATDIITGFPGETDAQHEESCHFTGSVGLSYMHVFSYSDRHGTRASLIDQKISSQLRQKRSEQLHAISEKKRMDFYTSHIGTVREVLIEERVKDISLEGFTDNYIRTRIPYTDGLSGKIARVRMKDISADGIMNAEII